MKIEIGSIWYSELFNCVGKVSMVGDKNIVYDIVDKDASGVITIGKFLEVFKPVKQ